MSITRINTPKSFTPTIVVLALIVMLLAATLPTQAQNTPTPTSEVVLPTATATIPGTVTGNSNITGTVAALTPVASRSITATQAATSTVSVTSTAPLTSTRALSKTVSTGVALPFDWASSENYLILGADTRPEDPAWRTDTIMILGLDRTNNRGALFSIPRDLYVEIPGYGMGRINQVDHLGETRNGEGGGPQLLGEVLGELLDVRIDHWVRMKMSSFVDFIDALGGVTIYLDCPFNEPILNLTTNRWEEFSLPPGENIMDGETAYWFVRLRLRESDLGRASRQRMLLWALRDKIATTNLLTRAPELWIAFQGAFTTDLNLFETVQLGIYGLSLHPNDVRASSLGLGELEDYTTAEGWRVLRVIDPALVRAKFHNVWEAPAMYQSYRHNPSTCDPLPDPDLLAQLSTPSSRPAQPVATTVSGEATATPSAPATTDNVATGAPTSRNANPDLVVGRRVRVRRGYSLTLRSQPGKNSGRNLGVMSDGEQAVILGGPAFEAAQFDTIVWWFVRTDSGIEAWAPANTDAEPLLQVWQ